MEKIANKISTFAFGALSTGFSKLVRLVGGGGGGGGKDCRDHIKNCISIVQ